MYEYSETKIHWSLYANILLKHALVMKPFVVPLCMIMTDITFSSVLMQYQSDFFNFIVNIRQQWGKYKSGWLYIFAYVVCISTM